MMCNTFVQFVLKRKTKRPLYFAPLQSVAAEALLKPFEVDPQQNNTVYYFEHNQLYSHSTAVLKLVRQFQGLWPILYGLILVPRTLRDGIYRWVARNRYKWFGKVESCALLPPELIVNRVLE